MPGTRTDYGQMFDHELNPRKGWAGDRGLCLEKTLPIASGQTYPIYSGSVVHINASNQFVLGRNATYSTTHKASVPLFAFANENDFDVNSDLGNIAGGVLMALCSLGDFELESTEVASAQTFVVGSYLTTDDGSGLAATGDIENGELGTDIICGIVSEAGGNTDGTFENDHGQNVVRFWTWFAPETLTAS